MSDGVQSVRIAKKVKGWHVVRENKRLEGYREVDKGQQKENKGYVDYKKVFVK